MKRKPHKKHWYRFHIEECPVCGRGGEERERVYGEKPKYSKEIYIFNQHYDYCLDL